MKTRMFKGLAVAAAVCGMLSSSGGQVYAAVDSTKDVAGPATESCNVSATLETLWSVNIPKHVTLDVDPTAKTGTADYTVSVRGQIEPSHSITVEPDSSFAMSCDDVSLTAMVTQGVTSFSGRDLTLDTPSTASGNISVSGMKGGTYSGNFDFHIAEEAGQAEHVHNYVDGKCTGCGEADPNHEHSYSESITKQPTCTDTGVKTFTCVCGDSHTETLPATSHNYVDGVCTECGGEDLSDAYALAPEGDIDNWSYELDDTNGTVALKHYDGAGTNVIVYANYPVNGKTYRATFGNNRLFKDCANIETIDFSKNIDTSNMTNMNGMFWGCSSLKSLDLSNFDTSNVWSMAYMFSSCSSLTSLDLGSFDTGNVTSMNDMFSGCTALKSLNLSSFDTSNVTQMNVMFNNCSSLTSLDVSSFDTSNVTNMSSMFIRCASLKSLDVSNFDTSSVTNMNHMFNGCSSLRSLDLGSFDTSKVTAMRGMFQDDASLTSIYVTNGKWVTSQVTDSTDMFKNCGTKSVTYR